MLAATRRSAALGLAPGDRVMSLGWSMPEEIVDNLLAVFGDGGVAGAGRHTGSCVVRAATRDRAGPPRTAVSRGGSRPLGELTYLFRGTVRRRYRVKDIML